MAHRISDAPAHEIKGMDEMPAMLVETVATRISDIVSRAAVVDATNRAPHN